MLTTDLIHPRLRILSALRIASALPAFCLLLLAASVVSAQPVPTYPPLPSGLGPPAKILDRYPQGPSLAPAFTIPVAPLGFSTPSEYFFLRRQSLVSLDFLDENRILFTFRASSLIPRNAGDTTKGEQQNIQALVLSLPSGNIESRAAWIVPDRLRYLWMLNDGHFFLRVPEGLDEGDAQLELTPNLRFPGRLLWIEMDPSQQFLIANSLVPASEAAADSATAAQQPNSPVPSATGPPATAAAGQPASQNVLVIRTLKRASGDVVRNIQVPWTSQTSDWPMNSEGYLESVRGSGTMWFLLMKNFAGGDQVMARPQSTCPPTYSFTSDSELFATACDPENGPMLEAISTHGDSLWKNRIGSNVMWPLLVTTPTGARVARETLLLKRSVDRYKRMLDAKDIAGQVVRVFDAANGKVLLESPLTPILDGGGNVAISPSGQRVAILNAGAIQVFQLPPLSPPAAK